MRKLNLVLLFTIYAYIGNIHANNHNHYPCAWPAYTQDYNLNNQQMVPQYSLHGHKAPLNIGLYNYYKNYNYLPRTNQYGNQVHYYNGNQRVEPKFTDFSEYKRRHRNGYSKIKTSAKRARFMERLIATYLCQLRHRIH